MITTSTALMFAGFLHGGVLAAAMLIPVKIPLRQELRQLSPMVRQLVCVHAGYVVLTIAAIGVASVVFREMLSDGSPLGRAVCIFAATFWTLRLGLSLWMRPDDYLDRPWTRIGYALLLITFTYFAIVYTWAAIGGPDA